MVEFGSSRSDTLESVPALAPSLRRWWWIPIVLAVAGALSAVSPWTTVCALAFALTFMLVVRQPLLGLLLFVAFQPILEKTIKVPMGRGLPDLSLGRLIVAFLLISLVGRAAMGRSRLAPFGLMELLTVAAPLGIVLAAPLSKQPLAVVQVAVSAFLLPLLLYFIAKNCVRNQRELGALFAAVMALGILATAYMIFELTTGIVLFPEDDATPARLSRVYSRSVPSLWLVKGLLSDSFNFGRVLITTIPISIYLFLREATARRRLFLAAAVLLQCVGLFLTLNRSSWVAFAVGLGIMQFAYPRVRRWLVLGAALALVTVVLYHRPIVDSVLVQKRVLYNLETLNGRLPRWQTAFEMWKVRPLSGWGFGRFGDESGRFRKDGETRNYVTPESDYFTILVGAGLIGFAPYVLSLLMPWFYSLRLFYRARAPDWRGFARPETIVIYWTVLCGLLLTSLTVNTGQPIVRGLVFTVAGGVVGTHEAWLRTARRPLRHSVSDDLPPTPASAWGVSEQTRAGEP